VNLVIDADWTHHIDELAELVEKMSLVAAREILGKTSHALIT
jgi:hypothetical protein